VKTSFTQLLCLLTLSAVTYDAHAHLEGGAYYVEAQLFVKPETRLD